jgi:Asp-tRNA(Asn)/Glu-tRNA(Gln) amidotransferase B subunit
LYPDAQERKTGMDGLAISPAALAEMIALIEGGTISGKIAKDVLPRLLDGEGNAGVKAFVEKQGLVQISGAQQDSRFVVLGIFGDVCVGHAAGQCFWCVCLSVTP